MVRGIKQEPGGRKQEAAKKGSDPKGLKGVRPEWAFLGLTPFALLFFIFLIPALHAAEAPTEDDSWLSEDPVETSVPVPEAPVSNAPSGIPNPVLPEAASKSDAEIKSLVLKIMVVNPSTKYKQTYPMKAYLPEEVKEEHILEKEDFEIGYDSEKKAYYISKEVELEPGASVVKAVRVQDIWFIAEEKLDALSEEARDTFEKLQETEYADQGRLLMNNIEVLLMQIVERQNDKGMTPNEHISLYRENKRKLLDIEMDLMAMRRFLASAGEGLMGNSQGKGGRLPNLFGKLTGGVSSKSSVVPVVVMWRIVFIILIFLGIASLLFILVFQHHIRLLFSRRQLMEAVRAIAHKDKEKEKEKEKEKKIELRIGDFYPGLGEDKPFKADDDAA